MKTGDVVQLKTGGPAMTVRYIVDYAAAKATGRAIGVHCDWFTADNMAHEAVFLEDQLQIAAAKP